MWRILEISIQLLLCMRWFETRLTGGFPESAWCPPEPGTSPPGPRPHPESPPAPTRVTESSSSYRSRNARSGSRRWRRPLRPEQTAAASSAWWSSSLTAPTASTQEHCPVQYPLQLIQCSKPVTYETRIWHVTIMTWFSRSGFSLRLWLKGRKFNTEMNRSSD